MPTLLVLRHARASGAARSDHERPLDPRGRRDAEALARHLAEEAPWAPDLVLCSTARRTRQTLDAVLEAFPAPPRVELEPQLYLAPSERLLARLQEVGDDVGAVLLVGHNPGVEDLIRELAGAGEAEARRRLRAGIGPATLAVLALSHCWSALDPGDGRLEALVRPADLVRRSRS